MFWLFLKPHLFSADADEPHPNRFVPNYPKLCQNIGEKKVSYESDF